MKTYAKLLKTELCCENMGNMGTFPQNMGGIWEIWEI